MFGEKYSIILKNKKLLKNSFISSLNIFFVLVALNLLSVNFSISEAKYMAALTTLLMVGLLVINVSLQSFFNMLIRYKSEKNYFYKTLIGIILIIFSFVILTSTKTQILWLVSIPILLSGLDLLLNGLKVERKELHLLAVTSFFYSVVYIIMQTTSFVWFGLQKFSLTISNIAGLIVGKEMLLGPSTSGLLIFIIFFIFGFSTFLLSKREKRLFIYYNIILFLFWIGYIIVLSFTDFESKSDVINHHFLFFLFNLIPTTLYLIKVGKSLPSMSKKNGFKLKNLTEKGIAFSLILILTAGFLITVFPLANNNVSEEQKNILFYGHQMLGNWDAPDYKKYGEISTGMFGLLPYYMNLSGYSTSIIVDNETRFMEINFPETVLLSDYENQTETVYDNETASVNNTIPKFVNFTDYTSIIESETITSDILSNFDVFVVINFNGVFSEKEQKAIWDFVDNGGGLLVLGDHTNMVGMQDSLNSLLEPTAIRFRFDSGLPIHPDFKWIPCCDVLHHPSMQYVDINIRNKIQISVGASLDIGPGTFPIIVGRYALSDIGDYSKDDDNYLGDYQYNEGEQIGDIILVAGEYYGSGRVLVFGDTSTFQNTAIVSSLPTLHGVFNWLSSGRTSTLEYAQVVISIVMFLAAAIFYLRYKSDNFVFAFFPIMLCIALVFSSFVNPILVGETEIKGNIIYISSSNIERFNLESYEDDSLSGFMINMMRNGYLPIIEDDISYTKMQNSEIVVFNAPTKTFSINEVNSILKYIKEGGVVILATGFDDKAASMPLLNEFGLDIEELPLGPIPYVEEDPEPYIKEPRFVDSWPIIGNLEDKNKFYSITIAAEEYVLMYFTPYGKGGFLLISDSMYLLDKNIESLHDYWPGNIQFLFTILDELVNRDILNRGVSQ